MKLTLPAFFTTDESQAKEARGEVTLYTDGEIRRVVIYNVTSLSLAIDDDKTVYTHLYDGATSYVIPLKIKDVERLVDLARKLDKPYHEATIDGFLEWKEKQKSENAQN